LVLQKLVTEGMRYQFQYTPKIPNLVQYEELMGYCKVQAATRMDGMSLMQPEWGTGERACGAVADDLAAALAARGHSLACGRGSVGVGGGGGGGGG
jgi:hypothetical protein